MFLCLLISLYFFIGSIYLFVLIFRNGVVERSDNYQSFNENFNRMVSTLPRSGCIPPTSSVLLPGQTYPDNSLMRTQSLCNVGNYNQPEKYVVSSH